jgi:hypothetical protein
MCLLSVNKKGCHIQKFQNSFPSLESVYLPRTSSAALMCSACVLGHSWVRTEVTIGLLQIPFSVFGKCGSLDVLTTWKGDRIVILKFAQQGYRRSERWHPGDKWWGQGTRTWLLSLSQTILHVSKIWTACLLPWGDMFWRYK